MVLRVRDVLAGRRDFSADSERVPWPRILVLVVLAGIVHGAAMGSLGMRPRLIAYGAIKLPILMIGATFLCLPNLWVVCAVLGLRAKFAGTVRGILCAQATLAITAASLAPVVAFVGLCGASYPFALLANAVVLALAAVAGQRSLRRHATPLVERAPRVRVVLFAWFVLHAFTSTKLAWILRPFVGDPELPAEFVRAERWSDDPFANLFWTAVALAASIARRFVD